MTNRRLRILALAVAAVGVAGCSEEAPAPSNLASSASAPAPAAGRFDPLSITLVPRSATVRQGKILRSRVIIENRSSTEVVDPSCIIAQGRSALVPVDQPDAELWMRPVVNCGGLHRMPPGYRVEHTGVDFYARTKYGKPLPPGRYLAVLEIEGYTQRLEQPVTVVR